MIEYENLTKSNASFHSEYSQIFTQILKSGWFVLGKQLENFEIEFANYCQSKFCIGVGSGLDALILSLHTLELAKGDEVIVPAHTFIATIMSILHLGMKPVLVEPCLETYNIDPTKIEEAITPRTKAIVAVHLYGKLCEMEKINTIAQKYNLRVIEDAAQAHGASYKNKKAGSWGDLGAFSFYPTKNLGALGDGGAITTQSKRMADILKMMRNYGSQTKYYYEKIGFNSRLDEMQAGFLSIKLKHLDTINAHKSTLAKLYLENLKEDFIKPIVQANFTDVYHTFVIRHPYRDKLKAFLQKNDIQTHIHYPIPPHHQKALQKLIKGHFPISEQIHQTILSLPISYFHTICDIEQVIEVMNKF